MERRFFTIGRVVGGVAKVSGLLPTEHAATIRALLDAYAKPKSSRGVAFVPADGVDGEIGPISVAAARQIACTGGRRVLVLGGTGEVLELGRAERIFTAAQRRAIAVRDRGCIIPGCTIPARWCEVHHDRAWCDGGCTDVCNGVLLCWFHHRTIDTGPWRIRMQGGVPEVRWSYGCHTGAWATACHVQVRGRSPGRARSPVSARMDRA